MSLGEICMKANVELLTEDEGRQKIIALLDSGEWWAIPWLNDRAPDVSILIEERYYATGEAAGDFLAMMLPAVTMTFGHKRRMSAEQLADILHSQPMRPPLTRDELAEGLKKRDIVIVMPTDTRGQDETALRAFAWNEWLKAGRVA